MARSASTSGEGDGDGRPSGGRVKRGPTHVPEVVPPATPVAEEDDPNPIASTPVPLLVAFWREAVMDASNEPASKMAGELVKRVVSVVVMKETSAASVEGGYTPSDTPPVNDGDDAQMRA